MSYGFADLHNHQFAQLGFGGRAVWGGGYGDITQELRWCTEAHGPGGTGDIMGNTMRTIAYKLPWTSIFGHSVGGYPLFDGWPRWDSISHQAVYEDWLYRAVEGGLRLMVMLAVNNEFFCSQANRAPGRGCSDMEAVDLQLQAAKDMQDYIDAKSGGPGQGWYRIVYTPEEARTVIAAGKLAVVLGIEVDYLFNCHSESDLTADQLRQELDSYFALGVRHIFPIHFSNNGFGGTAFQNALIRGEGLPFSVINPGGTIGAYTVDTEDAQSLGYEYRTGRRNVQGLTDLGKTLIRGMIARGMIIDIDHMSAYSKADTLGICEAANYPVVASHCGFVEICRGDKRHEGQLVPEEVERIRQVGGMVAVIVRQGTLEEIDTWRGPGQTVVEHACGGTSNTLMQAYLYAVAKMPGVPVGLGTDFNGFAGLPGPRSGAEACPGGVGPAAAPQALIGVNYPFTAITTGQQMDRSVVGDKTFDFNSDGLAHIGMLPDLIADFEAMGLTAADLEPLLNSAEGYVRMWEKARSHINDAQYVSQVAPPSSLSAGTTAQVTVTMLNTGNTTWTSSSAYSLGSQGPQDNTTWGTNRQPLPAPVQPGEQVSFTFSIPAPPFPGAVFQWQMVQDGVEWFGASTPALTVARAEPAECVDLRANIAAHEQTIQQLEASRAGLNLNPRDPIDRAEIRQIGREIEQERREMGALKQQASQLGCNIP